MRVDFNNAVLNIRPSIERLHRYWTVASNSDLSQDLELVTLLTTLTTFRCASRAFYRPGEHSTT